MKFDSDHFGSEAFDDEDRRYVGSRFADVKDALFRNAYYLTWGDEGEPRLPTYEVTLRRVLRGILPKGLPWLFKKAAERSVDSGADLRWGRDGNGFRRLLHPNGVSLLGRWKIDQPSDYTGYFAEGKEALVVGRYSTCCTETRRGYNRSLSLVGKLYPTTDPDHPDPLETANFITQEDLGGMRTRYINDAILRNSPDTTPWRRGLGLPILLLTGLVFIRADRKPTIRQLYPIAELGKPKGEATCAPRFMQLTVDPSQSQIPGDAIDFRDEVLQQIYDPGDPQPQRKLVFHIEVTDEGTTHGLLVQRRRYPSGWTRIGTIEFTEAVASYNSDFVVHFNHPAWRSDRNDPDTKFRQQ